jgi:dihydroxyacetone kinase-like protein
VQTDTIRAWLTEADAQISANSDYLTELDAAIGDADHGINMRRGFDSLSKAIAAQADTTPPGRLLIVAGKTLVATVGGASGPLWGSALRWAGRSLGDSEDFGAGELAAALAAALEGIVDLGAAAVGDKTMVDALDPAVHAMREALDAGEPLGAALDAASDAAQAGAKSTIPLLARKGRASYLGERSIGHQDPGATSTALIVAALRTAATQS